MNTSLRSVFMSYHAHVAAANDSYDGWRRNNVKIVNKRICGTKNVERHHHIRTFQHSSSPDVTQMCSYSSFRLVPCFVTKICSQPNHPGVFASLVGHDSLSTPGQAGHHSAFIFTIVVNVAYLSWDLRSEREVTITLPLLKRQRPMPPSVRYKRCPISCKGS